MVGECLLLLLVVVQQRFANPAKHVLGLTMYNTYMGLKIWD